MYSFGVGFTWKYLFSTWLSGIVVVPAYKASIRFGFEGPEADGKFSFCCWLCCVDWDDSAACSAFRVSGWTFCR